MIMERYDCQQPSHQNCIMRESGKCKNLESYSFCANAQIKELEEKLQVSVHKFKSADGARIAAEEREKKLKLVLISIMRIIRDEGSDGAKIRNIVDTILVHAPRCIEDESEIVVLKKD